MASEIRVNTINNRSGLGTISITNSGAVFSGVTTFAQIKTTSGEVTVGTGASVFSPATNVLALGTNNTEKVRITSTGSVGIGTDNPTRRLHVQSPGSTSNALFGNSANNNSIEVTRTGSTASYFQVQTYTNICNVVGGPTLTFRTSDPIGSASTERLRITSSGRIGVGTDTTTTNYGKVINVHNSGGAGSSLHLTDKFSGNTNSDGFELVYHTNDAYLVQRENANIIFMTNGTNERLRINSSGDVGIGTDNPGTLTWRTGQTLDVFAGSGNATGQLYLGSNRGDGAQSVGSIIFYDNTQTASHQNVAIIEVDKAGSGTNTRGGDILFYNKVDGGTSTPVTFKIRSGGNCEIPDGNLVFASGHGIDFSAASGSAAGSTSALLDDYEEGTFTPEFATSAGSTANISSQPATRVGNYTKIGNRVLFNLWINGNMTTTETTNSIIIQGLPIDASAGNKAYSAIISWNFTGFNTYKDEIILRSQPASDEVILQRNGTNLTFNDIVKTGINFMVSGQYISA